MDLLGEFNVNLLYNFWSAYLSVYCICMKVNDIRNIKPLQLWKLGMINSLYVPWHWYSIYWQDPIKNWQEYFLRLNLNRQENERINFISVITSIFCTHGLAAISSFILPNNKIMHVCLLNFNALTVNITNAKNRHYMTMFFLLLELWT